MTPKKSIFQMLWDAPDAIPLREAWQALRDSGATRDASAGTVRDWRFAIYTNAVFFIDREPAEALFVYNTLFTCLEDDKQRSQLLRFATQQHTRHAIRTKLVAS